MSEIVKNTTLGERKRRLVERILGLTKVEKRNILKLLFEHKVAHTLNKSGFFFNLGEVDEGILKVLENCIGLMKDNRQVIEMEQMERESNIKYYKSIITEGLKQHQEEMVQEYKNCITLKDFKSEIRVEVRRVGVRKKREYEGDADIDDIIALHQKRQQIPKNTSYWRIMSKLRKTNKRCQIEMDYHEVEEVNEGSEGGEVDYEMLEEEDDFDISGESEKDGGEMQGFAKILEDEKNEWVDEEEVEVEDDTFDIGSEDETSETEGESKLGMMKKYKEMLRSKGYAFADDRSIKVEREKYLKLEEIESV